MQRERERESASLSLSFFFWPQKCGLALVNLTLGRQFEWKEERTGREERERGEI